MVRPSLLVRVCESIIKYLLLVNIRLAAQGLLLNYFIQRFTA